jgi:hypothetical protein
MFLTGLAGIILAFIRLTEIFNISTMCNKKKNITQIDYNSTINLSINNNEEPINQTMSIQMTNTYLIEYMFFIIQGILKIGKEIDKNDGDPYSIKYNFYN